METNTLPVDTPKWAHPFIEQRIYEKLRKTRNYSCADNPDDLVQDYSSSARANAYDTLERIRSFD